jgi:hypothetical protein
VSRAFATTIVLTLAAAASAQAQTINTYTQSQTGPNNLVYGLPVPLPIESLTPVDGFRSYASLDARLQGLALASDDLSAHDVGRTHAGRTVWAYVASDADGVDVEGRPEAAFFINAATHAREWAAPEVSTGTIERLVAGASDGGLFRYLLDNTRAVIIPVQNIDGFLQTQRYPTQAIIGGDPDSPTWPRDGRMRRKNMPNVDEVLTTFGDRLGGIDLNRNHAPFWATSSGQGSSANPNSLIYHGAAPHSEPENLAIERAAELGPASRMRLGIDIHSFSRLFYTANTARAQLNNIQAALVQKLRLHHLSLSGKNYNDVPDPPNQGIGTASEYFGYTWLVPAWTLELEPQNSPVEYGGLNVNHGGFILPASEARRVRESWAETHAIAFYIMSGPPHLARVRYVDTTNGALALEYRWKYGPSGERARLPVVEGQLQAGRRYRIELSFNKPMRYRNAGGQMVAMPGSSLQPAAPTAALLRDAQRIALDTATGTWVDDASRWLRYRDDTFAFEFVAPAEIGEYRLEVSTSDFAGAQLDSNPQTPADWIAGTWGRYEGATGTEGVSGGPDATQRLQVASQSSSQIELLPGPMVAGEGDVLLLQARRVGSAQGRVAIEIAPLCDNPLGCVPPAPSPPTELAAWENGESGTKQIRFPVSDDRDVQGEREALATFSEVIDGTSVRSYFLPFRILDNDTVDAKVERALSTAKFLSAWAAAAPTAEGVGEIVLDAGVEVSAMQELPSGNRGLPVVRGDLRIRGNSAKLTFSGQQRSTPLIEIAAGGRLLLDSVVISNDVPVSNLPALQNDGELQLSRTVLLGGSQAGIVSPVVRSAGRFDATRTAFRSSNDVDSTLLQLVSGVARVEASTIGETLGYVDIDGGSLAFQGSTMTRSSSPVTMFGGPGAPLAATFGHALLQRNFPSQIISPPILENCGAAAASLGFNIEDRTRCAFASTGDRSGVLLQMMEFDEYLGGYAPVGAAVDTGASSENAAATGCGPVDQRGAPRPQTLTPGTTPRCDIGAIELGVNPYRGPWGAERSGHGVDIQTTGNQLFLVWYTYADDGQPTAYSAIAPLTGKHWESDLRLTSRNPQSGVITTVNVGRVTLDFDSDIDARLGWRFDARGITGSERVRPLRVDSGVPRFETTGLWSAPGDGGYGINIARIGRTTGATVYYYDAQGVQRWALGVSNDADATEFQMTSFTGFCPDCDAATNPVVGRPAGTALVHFLTPQRARADLQLVYPGAVGGTWNRMATMFVPLNDPVDNTAAHALLDP